MLLAAAGNAGIILVFDCRDGGIAQLARLTARSAGSAAPFLSAPCVYRLQPLAVENSFVVLACAADGKLYAAECDCDAWLPRSSNSSGGSSSSSSGGSGGSSELVMREIFDCACGVFCSPAVVPVLSVTRHQAPLHADAAAQQPSGEQVCVAVAVVMGGRDNVMRCLAPAVRPD